MKKLIRVVSITLLLGGFVIIGLTVNWWAVLGLAMVIFGASMGIR
jgi:hypothetical protein